MASHESPIPIVDAVRLTYRLLRTFWISALLQNIGVILLSMAFGVLILILSLVTTFALSGSSGGADAGFVLLAVVLYAAAYVGPTIMLFVGLFRTAMFGERDTGRLFGLRWSRRETCVLLRTLLLAVIIWLAFQALFMFAIPILLAVIAAGNLAQNVGLEFLNPLWPFALMLIFVLPISYVAMRLSLYVCAPAVDDRISLQDSWALTRGNGWRLVAIGLLVTIPVYLLSQLLFAGWQEANPINIIVLGTVSWLLSMATTVLSSFLMAVVFDYFVKPAVRAPSTAQARVSGTP